jgi:hypothetical protein
MADVTPGTKFHFCRKWLRRARWALANLRDAPKCEQGRNDKASIIRLADASAIERIPAS